MRYIIIDPEEGVFLGTKSDPFASGFKIVALFSKNNFFEITKAVSWETIHEAQKYQETFMRKGFPDSFIAEIDVDTTYVDVVDLVKAGYGEYAFEMIDAIPMPNTNVH